MTPIRLAALFCALLTIVLLGACTDSATTSDEAAGVVDETSITTPPTPPTPPTSKPEKTTPRSLDAMTPQEVVNSPDAELVTVALAPNDPDVRLSIWTALCDWCPDVPDGRGGSLGPATFTGMALTTDGYETAVYKRPRNPQLGYTVLSPRDDVFLLNNSSNGREWLVEVDDGTSHRVTRVDSELRPADPRLWFECGIARGDDTTWCSLDVDTATAYAWPESWSGSAVPPYVGDEPWGSEPPGWTRTRTGAVEDDPGNTGTYDDPGGGTFEAWWDVNGSRQRRPFTTNELGTVGGSPPGELAYWTRRLGSGTVRLHTSRDRGSAWVVDTRAAPGFNWWIQMTRSPDGALLAWTHYPRLVVWRAEASGGGFRRVHEASGPEMSGGGLWVQDDVVYANGSGTAAVSEDGGKTWTDIRKWRTSTRTPPPSEPTYTYTSAPGEVFLLPKDSDYGTMRAGRYEARRIGSPIHYEVDVPDGWRVLAGTFLVATTDGHGIFFVASLPKDRTDLAKHPCRDHSLFRVGPTVRDFTRAMQEQPVWEVSTPRPVTLDGHHGLYFEIEPPPSVEPADCVDGSVSEYESGRDGMATTQSYRGRWWVLEVNAERLVVMGRCYDTCTASDLDTLSAMAESITFPTG